MAAALAALIWLMSAAPAASSARPGQDVESAGYLAHRSAIDFCRARGDAGEKTRGGVACLNAKITPEVVGELLRARPLKIVVAQSEGGDTRAAMDLGLAIFNDRAVLIIDGECFSSCANYLVPAAAFRLNVLQGSFIGLHGSPPRDHHRVVDDYLAARGLSREDVPKRPSLFQEAARTYPNHVEQVIVPEVKYFARILVQEAFTTRFFELLRSIRQRGIARCRPERGTAVIVGPEYLKMFRIGTDYMWWPKDRSQIINILPGDLKDNYSLIFDADEHIGWSKSKGFLTSAECLPG